MNIYNVILTKGAESGLKKAPKYIIAKLTSWINAVTHDGLNEVRKIPGYHDEPLHGERRSQRSIRLSKSYRAIYVINTQGNMKIIEIIEVNKHDY